MKTKNTNIYIEKFTFMVITIYITAFLAFFLEKKYTPRTLIPVFIVFIVFRKIAINRRQTDILKNL